MKSTEKTDRQIGTNVLIFVGSSMLLLSSAALTYILSIHSKLRRASEPGRVVSATVTAGDKPLTTFTHSGQPGDPINIQFAGTDGQIGATFAAAGWYRADEIRLVTSARICADSVLDRKYSTAPVSNLYLFGRPDIDAERDLVTSELAQTGYVVQETTRPGFGKQTNGLNGEGDPYFTDGQVAVLTLANVVTPPLANHVHSPLLARITKELTGLVRPLLPEVRRKQGQQINK